MKKLYTSLFVLFLMSNAYSQIAITEFENNVAGSENELEFIELFNFSPNPVDLKDWTVSDEDGNNFTISGASLVMASGSYLVLAKNKTAFETLWFGGIANAQVIDFPFSTSLANGGDEIILKDNVATIIWSLAYANGETAGRATYLDYATDFATSISVWGSKASPGINRNGNDNVAGSPLGYEENDTAPDGSATSQGGETASPLAGTYVALAASSCAINSISLGNILPCNPSTYTFTAELIVTYTDAPGAGSLVINGQNFAITGSPQIVYLAGLTSNGAPIDVSASFSAEALCALNSPGLITAPKCLPAIAITEFLPNTAGNENNLEWIELFNYGNIMVDIKDWTLSDEDSDNTVITAASHIIPPGSFVILAKNKVAFEAEWLGGVPNVQVIDYNSFDMSNGGDEIILKNDAGLVIWSLAYPNGEPNGESVTFDPSIDLGTVTNIWGSKASPGVNFNGIDNPGKSTLGYERSTNHPDPTVSGIPSADVGNPLSGSYVISNLFIIPTLGEWGLIILMMLLLTCGILGIRSKQMSEALGTEMAINWFDGKLFFELLSSKGWISVVFSFGIILLFWGAIVPADIIGVAIITAIVIYNLQFLKSNELAITPYKA